MTHSFLSVSVRHPEVPRTHQRDEGPCVDLPQYRDVHSSQTRHLAVCKYAPREIPRSAGKSAELRDDAFRVEAQSRAELRDDVFRVEAQSRNDAPTRRQS